MNDLHTDFEKSQCLIVCHSDGYVEAYGPKSLSVKLVRMPHAEQRKNESAAEAVLEELLAPIWRKWFFPGCLRGALMNRALKPDAVMDSQIIKVMNSVIKELADDDMAGHTAGNRKT